MARKLEEWEHLLRELRAEFLLREKELELLHSIDLQLLKEEIFLEETLPLITDGTRSLVASDHASILLKRGPVLEVAYSSDRLDLGQRLSIPDSIPGICVSERRSIFIPDLGNSPFKNLYVQIAGYCGPPIRSLIEVPIEFREEAIGVLCVESCRPNRLRKVHTRVLETIASQVAIALQRVQHFKSEALFANVDQMITDPSDTHQVIQRALQRVMDELYNIHRVQFSGAQILFPRGSNELEIVHSTNPTDRGLSVSIDHSVCGRAVRESRTIVVGDVSKDIQYRRMLGTAIQSEMAVPITMGDDKILIGVLNIESAESDAFSGFNRIVFEGFADKIKTLLAFARLRADVTDTLESRNASDLLVAIGDQTSNLVHRINNTVGALRLRILELQELLAGGKVDADGMVFIDRSLHDMLRLADRTLEMPEQVARFLSKEQGHLIDVNIMVRKCVADISAPESIVVDTDLADDLPELSVYSFDIVLQNLMRNAIDAMPDGGLLEITTRLVSHPELPSGYVQVSVRDTGTGIPAEILRQIFELNFTTKRSKGKGLGLGLWWVRTFVLRSRGEIGVESTPGSGSTFTVRIPVATPVIDG